MEERLSLEGGPVWGRHPGRRGGLCGGGVLSREDRRTRWRAWTGLGGPSPAGLQVFQTRREGEGGPCVRVGGGGDLGFLRRHGFWRAFLSQNDDSWIFITVRGMAAGAADDGGFAVGMGRHAGGARV